MGIIFLISCVSKKEKNKTEAKNLYISELFKKSYNYAKKIGGGKEKIFILSAKYGIIKDTDVIEPYNITLNDFTEKQRKEWARKVYYKLIELIKPEDEIVFLAGENYIKYLRMILKNKKSEPMKGLKIGERLKYLKKWEN